MAVDPGFLASARAELEMLQKDKEEWEKQREVLERERENARSGKESLEMYVCMYVCMYLVPIVKAKGVLSTPLLLTQWNQFLKWCKVKFPQYEHYQNNIHVHISAKNEHIRNPLL